MTDLEQELAQRLERLRDSFDRTFAVPPAEQMQHRDEYLIVGSEAEKYALRVNALAGLLKGRKIVPLPVAAAGLLGLAGFRGQLVPVFSLASLLGFNPEAGAPPWFAVCRAEQAVALAFHRFHGSARISPEDIFEEEPAQGKSRQCFRHETGIVRIIQVPSIVAAACERLTQR